MGSIPATGSSPRCTGTVSRYGRAKEDFQDVRGSVQGS